MKHARFLVKFSPNKPSTCSLEPQYLGDFRSRLYTLQNTPDRKFHGVYTPPKRTFTPLLDAISCVGRGSILLENNSTFSECCINPENQLVLQQVQIHMLIHLNPLFNEDQESLLSGGSYPGPEHNRSRFLSPKHQPTSSMLYI